MGCTTVQISEGGSGVVYLVYKGIDRVVIKVRKEETCDQEDFLAESHIAMHLTKLNLPHVVQCYGTDKTQTCLMFEYQHLYQQPDLHTFLEQNKGPAPPNWLDHMRIILFQVLFTLAQLQSRIPQFRHNDTKCLNILLIQHSSQSEMYYVDGSTSWRVSAPFCVKLIDFGLSQGTGLSNPSVEKGEYRASGVVDNGSSIYDMHTLFLWILGQDPLIDRFIHRHIPENLFSGDALTTSVPVRLHPDFQMLDSTPRQALHDEFFNPLRYCLSPGRTTTAHRVIAG